MRHKIKYETRVLTTTMIPNTPFKRHETEFKIVLNISLTFEQTKKHSSPRMTLLIWTMKQAL